jgi:hypothetical protein
MKQKLTYHELKRFRKALSIFGALPGVPESYVNTKNLIKLIQVVQDLDIIANDLLMKRIERDEEGNPKTFNKTVPTKDGETEELRITDKKLLKEYREQMEILEKDTHEIDIHQVPYSRFKQYIDKNGVDNNILAVLLDSYILDDEANDGSLETIVAK